MEKEYQILSYIQEDENTSQRKLAQRTGLSLGTVNLLLKRMIRKGLVKTQRLNARSLRYILTPRGIAEKTSLTYNYIKYSCSHILKVTNALEQIVQNIKNQDQLNKRIILYGPADEVLEILQFTLARSNTPYTYIKNENSIDTHSDKAIVVVWDPQDEERIALHYKTVNIMKML